MSIRDKPWHMIYRRMVMAANYRIRNNLLPKEIYEDFKKQYHKNKKILSDDEMTTWLTDIQEKIYKYKKPVYRKPEHTTSGFERKTKRERTRDETAAIVIDEMLDIFIPRIPDKYHIDINEFEEDWRQELWLYSWQERNNNHNLKMLIDNYNRLSVPDLKFYTTYWMGILNKYIVPYIIKLKYSVNTLPMTYTPKYEEIYNVYEEVSTTDIDVSTNMMNIITDILSDKIMVNDIINKINELCEHNRNKNCTMSVDKYKQLIQYRYFENRSYEEIGKLLGGVSRQSICQTDKYLCNEIRKYYNNKKGG